MAGKVTTLTIWRVDVPPQVFGAVMQYRYVKDMDPINMNVFRVRANSADEARCKVWDLVCDCGVPVSFDDIKAGEYPSKIECFIK